MKRLIKYITIVFFAGAFLNSCETTELDLQTSPNALADDQADPALLLNTIQLNYATSQSVLSDRSAELTRIDYMFGRDYFNNYSGTTLSGTWTRTYSNILPDLRNLELIDGGSGDLDFHIGVAKTLLAHKLIQLVDFAGEAAFSQAGNPADFPAPELDSGREVYDSALLLLQEAQVALSGNPNTIGVTDLYFNEDTSKWIKLINTIRMKVAYTTGDAAEFNRIANNLPFIEDAEDDFYFQYGTSELQPDNRHPDYAADYTPSGANIYQSNWLMELMLDNNDPRIRYYFYRQVSTTPGADADPSEEDLACSLAQPPQHFLDGDYTYCSVPNGYWGRTHGNDEGTPPDNFKRAAVGVYPAGGRFDDDSFGNVGLGLGGGGAGIEPIIMSSYVDFWRGYMATTNVAKAAFLKAGMEKSIAAVRKFGALDPNADGSFAPDPGRAQSFVDNTVLAFSAATGDDQENIFAEQYWTAMYGGATEAWTYYRLTGFPTTLVPNWEPNPGPFPRTFLYPQNEVITNPNLTQKTTLTQQAFWDTNPASPSFPPAN